MPTERNDTRIVYGARCTWWDDIGKVGKIGGAHGPLGGLPCCPHCGSVLYELPTENAWFEGVDRYEAAGNPGYRAKVEWARGKCFKSPAALDTAYEARETTNAQTS